MGNRTDRQRITMLAREKTQKLDLKNHKTGWYALCRIWDNHPVLRQRMRYMGYGLNKEPLDFSLRNFGRDNGSKGKMPTLIHEWEQVGIQSTFCKLRRESIRVGCVSLQ